MGHWAIGPGPLIGKTQILDSYVTHVRPLPSPKYDFLIVTHNGRQFVKLTQSFGKMVFDAIGKCVHPMHYRQVIETESLEMLAPEWVSEDQKYGSRVAKVHYQKKRSRVVLSHSNTCMTKLRGELVVKVNRCLQEISCLHNDQQGIVDNIQGIQEASTATNTRINF